MKALLLAGLSSFPAPSAGESTAEVPLWPDGEPGARHPWTRECELRRRERGFAR